MAKRKLSDKDRAGVYSMIKRLVKRNLRNSEILKTVAKKYGISPETVRYYLKNLLKKNASIKKPAKAARRGAKRTGVRRKRRKRRASTSKNIQASAPALVKKAQAAARDRAREAYMLKRLLPEYTKARRTHEKIQGRLQDVRQLERAVSGSLRQSAKWVKKLETQLKGLISD